MWYKLESWARSLLAARVCHAIFMNNEQTNKAKKLAEQAKDRERMARIVKEEKQNTTRHEDVNQAATRIVREATENQ